MVFLHQVERRATDVRPTDDIDDVVNVRAEPAALARIHETLRGSDFIQDSPGPDGAAHRYRRQHAIIDVLAPDNLGSRAQLSLGAGRTVQAPGTTQAFRRGGAVAVEVDGVTALVRRPDLVGALIGKAAAVDRLPSQSQASRTKHLQDFDALARLIGPEDRTNGVLTKSERKLITSLLGAELTALGRTALESLLAAGTA